jgi:hypothetical protein
MQQKGLAQLQEAIDTMSVSEKESYLQALQNCPQLVQQETPPLWFLRYDNYDAWAAAQRLVYYWKCRYDIFGPQRAFLPMSQTGHGTLSMKDIEVLRTGYLVVLPKSPRTQQNILCYDASRLSHCAAQDQQTRLRCFFYFVSVLMEEDIHRTKGVMILGILNNFTIARSLGLHKQSRVFRYAFPVTLQSLHAVRWKASIPLLKSMLPLMAMAAQSALQKMHFHLGDTEEVLQSLEQAGFPASILPAQIGGEWMYSTFHEWCRERCQYEAEKYPTMIRLPIPASVPVPVKRGLASSDVSQSDDTAAITTPTQMSKSSGYTKRDTDQTRRAMRAIYSRQKRQRDKVLLNNLYERMYSLRNEQRVLVNENNRLSQLLVHAKQTVESHHPLVTKSRASAHRFW